ncbi:MAG: hypothetical protein V7774_09115 [Pseudorhizobium pelagicum]|uniref:hypothetical protein n=1 Tax=Pseudorhizobium pelagicum TaxID=1509405 RepID=UPI003460E427
MREHWDRWGWIVPAAALVVVFLRVIFGREAFCGSGQEHCLREWISSLGGWAAVIAAVPTIYYLSRQVSAAADHQRVNFAVSIRGNINLASAARQTAIEIRAQIATVRGTLAAFEISRPQQINHLLAVAELASDWLKRPVFAEFEARIRLPTQVSVATICVYIDSMVEMMKRADPENYLNIPNAAFETLVRGYWPALDMADKYAASICESADAFIADMDHLGSKIT